MSVINQGAIMNKLLAALLALAVTVSAAWSQTYPSVNNTLDLLPLSRMTTGATGMPLVGAGIGTPPAYGPLGSQAVSFTQSGTGAVPQTFDQLFRGKIVTPEMFGGVCGGADATAGIQAAINYLQSNGGGTVQFAGCYYYIGGLVVTGSGVRLAGAQFAFGNGTQFIFTPQNVGQAAISVGTVPSSGILSNFTMERITIRTFNTVTYKIGLSISDGSVVTIRDVLITGFTGGSSSPITGVVANAQNENRITVANASTLFNDYYAASVSGVTGSSDEINSSWPIKVVSGTTIDLQGSTYSGTYAGGGTLTLSSTGILTKGRELINMDNVLVVADIALRVSPNPNNTVNGLDETNLRNMTLVGSGTNCIVQVDNMVTMTSVNFSGNQSWGGGKSAFCWKDRFNTAISTQVSIENMRAEQKSVAGGWLYDVQVNNTLYSLSIKNPTMSDRSGVRLRNVANWLMDNPHYLNTGKCLDIDATVTNTQINNGYFYPGSTATLTGQYLLFSSGIANSSCLPATGIYSSSGSTQTLYRGVVQDTLNVANGITSGSSLSLGGSGLTGSFALYGGTSGVGTLQANAIQGTQTVMFPTTGGTMASNAISPITLDTAGTIRCPTCSTTSSTINSGTTNQLAYYSGTTTISGITTLLAAQFPALTGDITSTAGSLATTLSTVNANVGSFGSSTAIPNFTVDAKGRISAAGTAVVIAPAGTLTGATLASGVTASSLVSFGASPGFTGTPTTTTAAVDTNTTQVASTAYVVGQASSATPVVNGTGAAGTSLRYSRQDHVHPTDTSRAAAANPAFTGTATGTNVIPNGVLAQAGAATLKGNPTNATANVTDFTIQGLTARGAPDATNDKIPVYDNAAGTIKYVTPGQIAASATSGVSSLNGSTGSLNVRTIERYFTASTTYTPTTGMVYVSIEMVGGGGAGGGAIGSTSSVYSGGGGQAGTRSRGVLTAAQVASSTKAIVIGAGGTAGSAGASGNAGSATSFGGTLMTAPGGNGGTFGSSGSTPAGGANASAGTADESFSGQPGMPGFYAFSTTAITIPSGAGGSTVFGPGAVGRYGANSTGVTAVANSGGGGSGGSTNNETNSVIGGAGGSGYMRMLETIVN